MLKRLLTLGAVSFSLVSFAIPSGVCTSIFADAGRGLSASDSFWQDNQTATIQTPSGPKEFAFGFDAEIWHVSDVINLIASDPRAKAQAERLLLQHNLTYGHKKLANHLGYDTVAEFREDALLPGAEEKERLTIFDVKPSHYKKFTHGHREKSQYAKALTEAVTTALRNRNIPVTAKFESMSGSRQQGSLGNGSAIELIQNGSMTNKADFRKLILDFLDKEVEYPETHFHVSIPSDAVTPKQMLLAARALEAKITLEEVLAGLEYDGTLYPYDDSAIAKKFDPDNDYTGDEDFVMRGIVRVSLDRWNSPHRAHDVEIRQWFSAKHGLENMHFMMELTKNASRLRGTTAFTAEYVGDAVPPSLNASLRYAALLLKDRLPADKRHIPADLERFADRIEADGKIPPRRLQEIAKYFREHNVLKHITLDTFLEPEPGAARPSRNVPGRVGRRAPPPN